MISRTTKRFRQALNRLPPRVRQQAGRPIGALRTIPATPACASNWFTQPARFIPSGSAWTTRDRDTRGNAIIWFWIGPHPEYDKLVASL
jgi:hypothetical protein